MQAGNIYLNIYQKIPNYIECHVTRDSAFSVLSCTRMYCILGGGRPERGNAYRDNYRVQVCGCVRDNYRYKPVYSVCVFTLCTHKGWYTRGTWVVV